VGHISRSTARRSTFVVRFWIHYTLTIRTADWIEGIRFQTVSTSLLSTRTCGELSFQVLSSRFESPHIFFVLYSHLLTSASTIMFLVQIKCEPQSGPLLPKGLSHCHTYQGLPKAHTSRKDSTCHYTHYSQTCQQGLHTSRGFEGITDVCRVIFPGCPPE